MLWTLMLFFIYYYYIIQNNIYIDMVDEKVRTLR